MVALAMESRDQGVGQDSWYIFDTIGHPITQLFLFLTDIILLFISTSIREHTARALSRAVRSPISHLDLAHASTPPSPGAQSHRRPVTGRCFRRDSVQALRVRRDDFVWQC